MNSVAWTQPHVLPWETGGEADRLFRRVLLSTLGVLLVLSVTLPLLPLPVIEEMPAEEEPVLTRVVLEKQVLPQPEPVLTPKPKPREAVVRPEPKPVRKPAVQPKPAPKPVDRLAEARDTARATGVLAFRDDLASLRDSVDVQALNQVDTRRGVAEAATLQRAVITHKGPAQSGGIQAANLSTDTGGPALSGRETTSVRSDIAGAPRAGDTGAKPGTGQPGGRGDDAIRRVMDRNRGAIFALYNRALRSNPLLEGKLVFEMVIHPDGHVTELTLISSELGDEALTRRILSRIRLIEFGPDDVLTTRVNYSFDFLPYT